MTDCNLSKYSFLKEIGSGAYGSVWLAKSSDDTFCAVKIVNKTSIGDAAYAREMRGVSTYGRLPWHKGLIPVYDFWENKEKTKFYSVMALADDEKTGREINPETYRPKTLSSIISSRVALPMDECISMARLLLNGLEYLQNNHLIHRDIKPSNVLIINEEPVLTDFGLAIDYREANSIVGTPGYVPPENHGSVQGDIFSLGKLFYSISTGRSVDEFGYAPRAEADISSPLFPAWMKIINKACAPRLADRYFSSRAVLEDIENMLKRPRKKKRFVVLYICFLIALMAALFFFLNNLFFNNIDQAQPSNINKAEIGEGQNNVGVPENVTDDEAHAQQVEQAKETLRRSVDNLSQAIEEQVLRNEAVREKIEEKTEQAIEDFHESVGIE